MIPFDFTYHRPGTIEEAVNLYQTLNKLGMKPLYYAGGTEILTFGRLNKIKTKAVIDIKQIPECSQIEQNEQQFIIGAAVSLSKIRELKLHPLLDDALRGIADHTSRNKITIGGNLCGRVMFHEALLPLLLLDSKVVIVNQEEQRTVPIAEIWERKMQLAPGELLTQIMIDKTSISYPYVVLKKRRQGSMGYPLITVAAVSVEGAIRVAFSGLCSFPFRSTEIEDLLNDSLAFANISDSSNASNSPVSMTSSIEQVLMHVPDTILEDSNGTAEYRKFVLESTLMEVYDKLKGVHVEDADRP